MIHSLLTTLQILPQFKPAVQSADDYRIALRDLAEKPVIENEQKYKLFCQIVSVRQCKEVGEYCHKKLELESKKANVMESEKKEEEIEVEEVEKQKEKKNDEMEEYEKLTQAVLQKGKVLMQESQ